MPFRFHVVALPHTQTNLNHCACAYTMKVYNFCRMMKSLGHTVFHYGAEESDPAICTEHVTVITRDQQRTFWGDYDFHKEFYKIEWDNAKPYWQLANTHTLLEVLKRVQPGDYLCTIAGYCQKPISDGLGDKVTTCEFGIGYTGCWAPVRCYESYCQMTRCLSSGNLDADGQFYHTVVPNYFDPAMFPLQEKKDDYLLFVGRLIRRKGVTIAADTAKALGMRLLVAGQGMKRTEPGLIVCEDGTEMRAPKIEYIGFLDVQRRAEVMGKARAVMVPTIYLEPFGGVNVEAQMCGTPAITTDWGAFPETVEHGVTGFRARVLDQFCWAVDHAHELDPHVIRERAIARYSMWNVRYMYQEVFTLAQNLRSKQGWFTRYPDRRNMRWLGPYRQANAIGPHVTQELSGTTPAQAKPKAARDYVTRLDLP